MPFWYVTSHSGQLSLLTLAGWEMSTSQSVVMLCGWQVEARMTHCSLWIEHVAVISG